MDGIDTRTYSYMKNNNVGESGYVVRGKVVVWVARMMERGR